MDSETYAMPWRGDFYPSIIAEIGANTKNSSKLKSLWTLTICFRVVFLLKKDEAARNYYQNLWEYILIDEYQDTNKSQYELSKFLSAKHAKHLRHRRYGPEHLRFSRGGFSQHYKL